MPKDMKKRRLSKSIVGMAEKEALAKVIDDSYLGMGKFVDEFERSIEQYIGGGVRAICVNSGTAALHLALMGIGIKPGDEVLVQSLTFVACFQAISAAGAIPIPCEVLPETCTIDLKYAEKKITKKTRAIMPVHYASRTGDLDAIYKFAAKHGIRVIEDASHAFGSIYKKKMVGSFGDVACFSFDGIKNITSGEGGAVITKDDSVAQIVMDARLLGVHKDTEKRYEGKRSWEFEVYHQGYRYHMSNLFAAIGLAQLGRFEKEFKPYRQKLAKRYYGGLKGMADIVLFPNDFNDIVPHIFPIRVMKSKRDGLRQHLIDNGIECGVHYYPNHLLGYYGKNAGKLPVTEKIYSELLSLPLHPDITEDDQDYILKNVREGLE